MFAILKLKFHFRRITEIRKAEEHIYEIVLERLRCRGLCLSKHPDRSMFEFKGAAGSCLHEAPAQMHEVSKDCNISAHPSRKSDYEQGTALSEWCGIVCANHLFVHDACSNWCKYSGCWSSECMRACRSDT
jgi:hypothetical protein